jgi:hypothetical protein
MKKLNVNNQKSDAKTYLYIYEINRIQSLLKEHESYFKTYVRDLMVSIWNFP